VQQRHEHHRKPSGQNEVHVAEVGETERHEGVEDPRGDPRRRAAGDHPAEEKGGEAGEGEA
jgi:hypothetical protein